MCIITTVFSKIIEMFIEIKYSCFVCKYAKRMVNNAIVRFQKIISQ